MSDPDNQLLKRIRSYGQESENEGMFVPLIIWQAATLAKSMYGVEDFIPIPEIILTSYKSSVLFLPFFSKLSILDKEVFAESVVAISLWLYSEVDAGFLDVIPENPDRTSLLEFYKLFKNRFAEIFQKEA